MYRLACSFVLSLLLLPALAYAQPSSQAMEQYRSVATQGQDAFNRRDFAEARRLWLSARDILPNPRVYRLLGRAAGALEDHADAVRMFRLSLSVPDNGNPLSPRHRQEVERELLPASLARVGELTIELAPADAQILVDGRPAQVEEGSLLLSVGAHTLQVQREGYTTREERVDVRAGMREPLRIELAQAAVSDANVAPPPSAPASGGPDLVGPLVLFGAAAAGFLVFAIGGGLALAENDRLSADCGAASTRTCMPEQLSDLHTFAALADVGLTVGILAAAGGAAWLAYALATAGGESASALRIAPFATADAGGVLVSGRLEVQ
jgi:PEGA domain-containing protein